MDKYPEITFTIENKFKQLCKDKLTPWEFLNAGKMGPIKDFNGRTIQYSGVGFEGSPREVFWGGFIEPFLESFFVWAFRFALEYSERRKLNRRELILYTRECLTNGIRLTYSRMQKIDRMLRGKGFPDRISPRDISREINTMQIKLDEYRDSTLVALKGNITSKKSKTRFYNRWWFKLFFAPFIVGLILLFLKNNPLDSQRNNFHSSSANDNKDFNIAGDVVGRDKIIYQPAAHVPPDQVDIDRQGKIKISKVKINRIIEDLSLGINEIKKEYFKGNERIANDFNSRNMSSSGMHIKAQMDFAISIKQKIEALLIKSHRNIEDVLLGNFGITNLAEMKEFSEEDKKLYEIENNIIPALYKQLEDAVRNREVRSLGNVSITKNFKLQ